ncbi:MAG: kelch repeat-containing protein [Chloroflexota bacterium]
MQYVTNFSRLARGLIFLSLVIFSLGIVWQVSARGDSPEIGATITGTGLWVPSGDMNSGRSEHTSTLLADGNVLVTGGYSNNAPTSSAELYDSALGQWTATDSMDNARYQHTALMLPDGKILVAGGQNNADPLASAELYDPSTHEWSTTGSLNIARFRHTMTLLPNGQVLVAGGSNNNDTAALTSAELYDPDTGQWSITGELAEGRVVHEAVLLTNGQVLVMGGFSGGMFGQHLSSAELYDPDTAMWSATEDMITGRNGHTATLLTSGEVLLTGGWNGAAVASSELYDPGTGEWSATGNLNAGRNAHTATLLADGTVLVTGGRDSDWMSISAVEVYDPVSGEWSSIDPLNTPRQDHTATLLQNEEVLVVGGKEYISSPIHFASTEVTTWYSQPDMQADLVVFPESVGLGEIITYTITITNSGNVVLNELNSMATVSGDFDLPESLAPDMVVSASYSYMVTTADLPGPLTNEVMVTAVPPGGDPLTITITATTFIEVHTLFLPVILNN